MDVHILQSVLLVLSLAKTIFSCPEPCQCNTTTNTIDCSGRSLVSIPEFRNIPLPKIVLLDLSRNNLTVLDTSEFGNILGFLVETIDVSFNQITRVSGEFSDGNEAIGYRTLNLSNNLLTNFPRNIVPNKHLKAELIIDISYNLLQELPANMFDDADNFYPGFQLIAQSNQITYIHPDAFRGPVIVDAILDFRNNSLAYIPEELKLPEGVRSIKMADNPWICDCKFRWISGSRYRNLSVSSPPTCDVPEAVAGRPLFGLSRQEFACAPTATLTGTVLIDEGRHHLLVCPVTADPPNPLITWTLIHLDGTDDPFSIEVQSPSLKLTNLKSNDVTYRCRATNPAGSVTVDIQLNVTSYDYDDSILTTVANYAVIGTDDLMDSSETALDGGFVVDTTEPSSESTFVSDLFEGSSTDDDDNAGQGSTTAVNSIIRPTSSSSDIICVSYSSFAVFLICLFVVVCVLAVALVCSTIYCCRFMSNQKSRKLNFKARPPKSEFAFDGPGMYTEEADDVTGSSFHFIETSTAL